ncbi:FGFR1 oncogene partner 2 homolog [Mytilus edulis]|uniref:Suppressor of IKBKE 1,FGFR1 oncogene partner 2,FGFR1 oncogene partner 2 homolog n=2 Tax=Mytilus edulis TaxID=6550 RepID=A0A8S3PPB7_MYTED|nr:Suppressor of IKBKE 1,FGFR1 oncogene partner 2,FGFR1 oncogene partner 2 homolog [Mytilus edulis]
MALNFEKLLNDAKILVTRLKTHDSSADVIIAQTQTLHNRIDSMKQYQDDINELNEIARHRPRSTLVLGIAQENRQIRELQQENKELCLSLEEHQSALELIMQKYREQIMKLLQSNRVEKSIKTRQDQKNREIEQLIDKISEMAAVMQKAASVDDQLSAHDHEKLTQLQLENNGLREILEVCTTAKQKILDNVKATDSDDKSAQTDQSSDQSFESLDSQGENEPVNKASEND